MRAGATGGRRITRRAAALTGGAVVVALLCGAPLAPAASAAPLRAATVSHTGVAAVDTASRASVSAAYRKVLVPALTTPVHWTGRVKGCRTGSNPVAVQRAVTRAVNVVRALDHLPNTRYDAAASSAALRAALVMQANRRLSHHPKQDGLKKCLTATANTAAGRSNLELGSAELWSDAWAGQGAGRTVVDYMTDSGSNNLVVGHRRWLLWSGLRRIASGTTAAANALEVLVPGNAAPRTASTWAAWPSSGWFPTQLEPDGRWSLSAPAAFGPDDFASARVTVVRGSTSLPVHVIAPAKGTGPDTLSWQVRGVRPVAGTASDVYRVTVSGIRDTTTGTTFTKSYAVTLFNPWNGPAPTRIAVDHDRLVSGSVSFDFQLEAHGQSVLGKEHVVITVDGHRALTARSPAGSVLLNETPGRHRVRFRFAGTAFEHAATRTVTVRF